MTLVRRVISVISDHGGSGGGGFGGGGGGAGAAVHGVQPATSKLAGIIAELQQSRVLDWGPKNGR